MINPRDCALRELSLIVVFVRPEERCWHSPLGHEVGIRVIVPGVPDRSRIRHLWAGDHDRRPLDTRDGIDILAIGARDLEPGEYSAASSLQSLARVIEPDSDRAAFARELPI